LGATVAIPAHACWEEIG